AYGGYVYAARNLDRGVVVRCPGMGPASTAVRHPPQPDGTGGKKRGGHGAALKIPYRVGEGGTGYGTRPRAPRAAAALHCPGGRAPLRNPLAPDNGAWTEYAAAQKRLQAFRATESCGSGAELIDFVY